MVAMAEKKGQKRTFISISSSPEQDEEEEQSQSEYDGVEDSIGTSTSCDDDDDDDDDDDESQFDGQECEEDEYSDYHDGNDDVQSVCDRILGLLKEGSDLRELNLAECKTYLRKHRLRLSGAKAECIQRIKEHWRIKHGNSEKLYPPSSFTVNCTGDVCKGDTVMFTQEVYQKFDKVTRRGCLIGKRSIAGRIVKESYGAAKQQHTFTVEVLWSRGVNVLPPLFPLLVKGRNLYKLRTFRQRWKNEAERSRVLAEKHKRGAAARHVRGLKKKRKKLSTYSAAKHQKHSHHKPSRTKQTTERHRENFADRREKHAVRIATPNARHQKPVLARQNKTKQSRNSRASASCMRHENLARPLEGRDPTFHPYSHPSQALGKFYRQRAPLGSPSLPMSLPHFRHWADPYVMPTSESRGFNHSSYPHYAYPNPYYVAENFNRFPQFMNPCNPLHPYSSQTETFDQRKYGL